MDGRGVGLRHCLLLWCLLQATFAAGVQDDTCPRITHENKTGGTIPLYMGIFPKADKWKLDMFFTGDGALFRLSLYQDELAINAETMTQPDDGNNHPKVKWDPKAFPKEKWSYLALYPEEKNLVISQRQDMEAETIKRIHENNFESVKIKTNNVSVTYNCSNGNMITFAKETIQVDGDETYVQAAGSEVRLSDGNSTITVTNNTWDEVGNGSYSLNGLVFVRYSLDGTVIVDDSLQPVSSLGTMSPSTLDIIMCFVSLFVLSLLSINFMAIV